MCLRSLKVIKRSGLQDSTRPIAHRVKCADGLLEQADLGPPFHFGALRKGRVSPELLHLSAWRLEKIAMGGAQQGMHGLVCFDRPG